jgi:hypothetical protein
VWIAQAECTHAWWMRCALFVLAPALVSSWKDEAGEADGETRGGRSYACPLQVPCIIRHLSRTQAVTPAPVVPRLVLANMAGRRVEIFFEGAWESKSQTGTLPPRTPVAW